MSANALNRYAGRVQARADQEFELLHDFVRQQMPVALGSARMEIEGSPCCTSRWPWVRQRARLMDCERALRLQALLEIQIQTVESYLADPSDNNRAKMHEAMFGALGTIGQMKCNHGPSATWHIANIINLLGIYPASYSAAAMA